ncbi:hypothetical protein C8R46DRAFT_1343100 [Mycena filopes]|nr:hypothetical protein C8R46DRAFT_1343100 [Mycena filopes]
MPSADHSDSPEEREKDEGRGGGKKSAASKTKDLSHVPCKFYKVGSCTAGSSCPFSHSLVEAGGQKDVCAWFVKGNCKFGHKCALAHVLPGQTMAMDRKNKKAAQIAAGGAKNQDGGGRGRGDRKRDGGNNRNPLLAGGSTAPTRPRPPMSMPLKATISPSAPAPPLKDTDFASFAVLDEATQLPTAPARTKSPSPKLPSSPTLPVSAPRRPSMSSTSPNKDFGPIGSPPSSATSPSSRMHSGTPPTQANGFLSTSPFSAPGTQSVYLGYADAGRKGMAASLGSGMTMGGGPGGWNGGGGVNGASSSPLRTSLLSAGRQNGAYDLSGEYDLEFGTTGRRRTPVREESTEDLEDFLPSSLTDLLTPEERMRRMSRTNSGQSPGYDGSGGSPARHGLGVPLSQHPGGGAGHRYSRSVPAPSLLGGDHGQLKSIWAADQGPPPGIGLPSSPMHNNGGLGPSSYSSARSGGFGGRDGQTGSYVEDLGGMGMSMGSAGGGGMRGLSPSNASGAFLPSIHHYINQNKQRAAAANNGLNASNANNNNGGAGFANNAAAAQGPPGIAHYLHAGPSGVHHAMNASNSNSPSPGPGNANNNAYVRPNPFDLTQQMHRGVPAPYTGQQGPPGIPGLGAGETHILSPNARALQAHAPGQSLPQGLAAGYSRIHALPPMPGAGSPSPAAFGSPSGGGMGVGVNVHMGGYVTGGAGTGGSRDWATMSPGSISGSPGFPPSFMSSTKPPPPPAPAAAQGQGQGKATSPPTSAGLESMFSRLSYSAAAGARGGVGAPPGVGAPTMQRGANTSGGAAGGAGRWSTPRSPLSPPVAVPGRDVEDDLFPLDE